VAKNTVPADDTRRDHSKKANHQNDNFHSGYLFRGKPATDFDAKSVTFRPLSERVAGMPEYPPSQEGEVQAIICSSGGSSGRRAGRVGLQPFLTSPERHFMLVGGSKMGFKNKNQGPVRWLGIPGKETHEIVDSYRSGYSDFGVAVRDVGLRRRA
jgi:hypothetical protein